MVPTESDLLNAVPIGPRSGQDFLFLFLSFPFFGAVINLRLRYSTLNIKDYKPNKLNTCPSTHSCYFLSVRLFSYLFFCLFFCDFGFLSLYPFFCPLSHSPVLSFLFSVSSVFPVFTVINVPRPRDAPLGRRWDSAVSAVKEEFCHRL